MPEYLRSLIVILFLATLTFAFSKKALGPQLDPKQFNRWRNTWFIVTLIAFLSQDFWVYIVASAIFLLYTNKRETNKFALFLMLLLAVPMISQKVSGFGVINYLFKIHYLRLLSLAILLPAFLYLKSRGDTLKFGRIWPDKLLLGYIVLVVLLNLRDSTFSDTMRAAFYQFTDVFLPYYVASRGIKSLSHLKEAMAAFVLACFLAASIGMVEFVKHWLLYNSLQGAWNIPWDMISYLERDGDLRALASVGQPIVLGYIMAIGLGFYLLVSQSIHNKLLRRLGLALLLAGLFVPLSRGPWVGAAALLVTFIATGPNAMKNLSMLGIAAILSLPILNEIPGGEKIVNLIPFIGTTETENIDYRQKLIDNSLIVIKRKPVFGSTTFREEPEMQEMMQGEGIIDIVNSYIGVALEFGLAGLALFTGFFAVILLSIYKAMGRVPGRNSEDYLFGRALLATLIGILVTISTVSSIVVIPVLYWSVAGLGVAYMVIMRKQGKAEGEEPTKMTQLPTSRLKKSAQHP